jgi:hypothetical protein
MLGPNQDLLRLRHWQSDALTARLDLFHISIIFENLSFRIGVKSVLFSNFLAIGFGSWRPKLMPCGSGSAALGLDYSAHPATATSLHGELVLVKINSHKGKKIRIRIKM